MERNAQSVHDIAIYNIILYVIYSVILKYTENMR